MMDGSLQSTLSRDDSLPAFLAGIERRAFRHAEIALKHREDALDAVQDAMLKLVQRYADKPSIEWSPLFWSVLRSRITDIRRRRRVRSVLVGWMGFANDDDEAPVWEPTDPNPGPDHLHADRESYCALSTALQALPRRQREAYQLRVLEGLGVADTARAMGCSEGSVKTHTSRAMEALRKQLEDWR